MKKSLAMILAGGVPTKDRFSVLTMNRSKASLPFGGIYRLIDFSLSNFSHSNIEEVGIITQFLPSSLIDHIGDGVAWDMKGYNRCAKILPPFISYETSSSWYKGTGDALWENLNFVYDRDPDYVFVVSGENIYNLDMQEVVRFHDEHDQEVTLVYCSMDPEKYCDRFGYVHTQGDRVEKLFEKPDEPKSSYISTGIYLFSKDAFLRYLTQYRKAGAYNFVQDLMIPLIESGKVAGYEHTGPWEYINDFYDFYRLQMDLADGTLPIWNWGMLTNQEDRNSGFRPPLQFKCDGVASNTVIANGCLIEGTVDRSILSPGVKVAKNARIYNSIIMHDCEIGEGAFLNGVICDKDVTIDPGIQIGNSDHQAVVKRDELTIIGKGIHIQSQQDIQTGQHLDPQVLI